MKGRLPAGAGALVALALGMAPVAASAATSGVEQISSYDVRLTVSADGSLHVTETIDYDFGFQQRHGIIRVIPEVVRYDDTDNRA